MSNLSEVDAYTKGDSQVTKECEPCLRDNKHIPCVTYCSDCQQHYCITCTQFHSRFPGLKDHNVNTVRNNSHSTDDSMEHCKDHVEDDKATNTLLEQSETRQDEASPPISDPLINVPKELSPAKSPQIPTPSASSPSPLLSQEPFASSKPSKLLTERISDESGRLNHEKGQTSAVLDQSLFGAIDKCPYHDGEPISVYCGDHDVVCCKVCVAITHRTCSNIKYIPDIAQAFVNSRDMVEYLESIDRLGKGVMRLRDDRTDDSNRLSMKKEDIVKEVKRLHEGLLKRIDAVMRNALSTVDLQYDVFKERIERHVSDCETARETFEQLKDTLNNFDTNQAIERFIVVKRGNTLIEKEQNSINAVCEYVGKENLGFSPNSALVRTVMGAKGLGTLSISDKDNLIGRAQRFLLNESGSLESVCDLPDGRIAILRRPMRIPYHTLVLRRNDQTDDQKASFELQGMAYGMCFSRKTHELAIAVTVEAKGRVAFVKLSNSVFSVDKVAKGFPTEHTVFGISCLSDVFIVGSVRDVYTYNREGTMLHVLFSGLKSDILRHIAVRETGSTIYVANYRKGILELNTNGEAIQVMTDKYLQGAHGVCVDGDGYIVACGYESGCIVQFNKSGCRVGVCRVTQSPKEAPLFLYYRPDRKSLAVTFKDFSN